MLRGLFIVVILSFATLGASMAEACQRPNMPRGADKVVPTSRINQSLFNKAVLAEVNYYRCRNGRKSLRGSQALVKSANGHSAWMAKNQKLSHTSSQRGQRDIGQRIRRTYGKFSRASENIASVQRFLIDNGQVYYPKNVQNCHFETSNRQRIPPHTYASLAKRIVKLWVDSPSHRRNIMDSNVQYVGTAIQFDAKYRNCGAYFATQNFAG
ncbi:CAP domain-containing protein [Parasulfitobacter algicola]|uniref:SCP domain-containing protein n=1 Tax=Parasulfitobacter algicola TaxID=2614809 RepID=A0ABX2IWU2_9RHOB|nr:CAP domain-containing protein [Sulfitobacter algicola]NSX54763.1 hypothetical protein [Sulfitobacter algicola]